MNPLNYMRLHDYSSRNSRQHWINASNGKISIKTLNKIVRHTNDLSLFTDGERRYGNLLFEICYELVKNGQPGRPKKTFKRGVHVRIKNKGSQAHRTQATHISESVGGTP